MDAQRAIADFLDRETARIDSLIAAKRRMIELLREHYRSLLDAIFALPDVPRVPLGRFVVSFTQGRSPQAEDRTPNPGEWGVLKLSAVKVGKFEPNESKALAPAFKIDPTLAPRRGDLLVTRSNTPDYVGDACAVVDDPGLVILCDLIYRLRLDRRLLPEFAAAALLGLKLGFICRHAPVGHRSRWSSCGART